MLLASRWLSDSSGLHFAYIQVHRSNRKQRRAVHEVTGWRFLRKKGSARAIDEENAPVFEKVGRAIRTEWPMMSFPLRYARR